MLGTFYLRVDESERAREYYKDCMKTRKTLYGQGNKYVMDCILNLGLIDYMSGNIKCIQQFQKYIKVNNQLSLGISPLLAQLQ